MTKHDVIEFVECFPMICVGIVLSGFAFGIMGIVRGIGWLAWKIVQLAQLCNGVRLRRGLPSAEEETPK